MPATLCTIYSLGICSHVFKISVQYVFFRRCAIYHAYFSITMLPVIPLLLLLVCALSSYGVTATSMALPLSVISELTVGSVVDNTWEGGTQAMSESDVRFVACFSEERPRPAWMMMRVDAMPCEQSQEPSKFEKLCRLT